MSDEKKKPHLLQIMNLGSMEEKCLKKLLFIQPNYRIYHQDDIYMENMMMMMIMLMMVIVMVIIIIIIIAPNCVPRTNTSFFLI